MLGKASRPVIEILAGSLVSGNWSGQVDSPRSLLEPKTQSPRTEGPKSFGLGGVGLAIVAAIENSGSGRSDTPAIKALFGRSLSRPKPIPVSSPRNNRRESESPEEYTVVTCHGPNESYTKVYSGAAEGGEETPFRIKSSGRTTVFHISPAEASGVVPVTDFLNSCDMCRKKLHGKDIYMYRGENAFCSTECRYKQIVADERKEKCSSEASRPAVEVAGSPYANEQILTTGILAI